MKHLVLFDGSCGVCTRAADIAKRMDHRAQFAVEPYQSYSEAELHRFGLSYAACGRRLRVVTRNGGVHSGVFAVNYFLWAQFPWTLLVFVVYAIPVLLLLELVGYEIVAANRHRISAWFGLTECARRGPPDNKR